MIKQLLARLFRKEPAPNQSYKPQSQTKFDAKFYEGVKALPISEPEMCVGCQQAVHRINTGAHTTMCHVCGCFWLSKSASLEFRQPAYKLKPQEEFDAKFHEDGKPFREYAAKVGCDMALFDMLVAIKKGYIDEFRANAQHFYQQRPGTPSGK